MGLPQITMSDLVKVGAHFGHKTYRWNPKMSPYIFDSRQGIHILDMTQTVPCLQTAMAAVQDIVARNGRLLFVGTKRQAAQPVAEAAERCSQCHVNHRWLGGMMTNWKTVAKSIKRLEEIELKLEGDPSGHTKKELLNQQREYDKLQRTLGGMRSMDGAPDMLFVIDTNREAIAIKEANRLNIPVVAIIDSDSNPEGVTYPIPGNDDSAAAVSFYCNMIAEAALSGVEKSIMDSDVEEVSEAPAAPASPDAAAAPAESQE